MHLQSASGIGRGVRVRGGTPEAAPFATRPCGAALNAAGATLPTAAANVEEDVGHSMARCALGVQCFQLARDRPAVSTVSMRLFDRERCSSQFVGSHAGGRYRRQDCCGSHQVLRCAYKRAGDAILANESHRPRKASKQVLTREPRRPAQQQMRGALRIRTPRMVTRHWKGLVVAATA